MGLQPWYEAVCLAYGAATCVSIDYNRVSYTHQRLEWMSVLELQRLLQPHLESERVVGGFRRFEVCISISSVEHDGLGRYGDKIDADADLAAMRLLQEALEPAGRLLLAVPVGSDLVRWNMHRIYGKLRLPMLLEGWTILGAQGWHADLLELPPDPMAHHQPVFILENTNPSTHHSHYSTLQRLRDL
jgi:hypothetical protein